jgi:hypothetical protein
MAELKIPPHVIDRVLNHVSGTIKGGAATYNGLEYLEERKAALDTWGRYVDSLINGRAGRVRLDAVCLAPKAGITEKALRLVREPRKIWREFFARKRASTWQDSTAPEINQSRANVDMAALLIARIPPSLRRYSAFCRAHEQRVDG